MSSIGAMLSTATIRAAEIPIPTWTDRPLTLLALGVIGLYRMVLSGRIGTTCMYNPSCSTLTLHLLKTQGWNSARLEIADRLKRCNGLYTASHDGEGFVIRGVDGKSFSEAELSAEFVEQLRRNHRHRHPHGQMDQSSK